MAGQTRPGGSFYYVYGEGREVAALQPERSPRNTELGLSLLTAHPFDHAFAIVALWMT
jgi:hypothetical protein